MSKNCALILICPFPVILMHSEFVCLSINSPYPFPLPGKEGALADFLRQSGNRLLITMPDISDYEAKALRRGNLNCGMLAENGAILLLWQFCDKRGKTVMTLDSPFDARVIPDLNLHSINNSEQRLVIETHIVDSSTKIIRGLRAITMPPELTVKFLSAVQDQLSSQQSEHQMQIWMQQRPDQLFSQTQTYQMGL